MQTYQIAGLALAMVSALNATPSVASEAAYEVTNLVSEDPYPRRLSMRIW